MRGTVWGQMGQVETSGNWLGPNENGAQCPKPFYSLPLRPSIETEHKAEMDIDSCLRCDLPGIELSLPGKSRQTRT